MPLWALLLACATPALAQEITVTRPGAAPVVLHKADLVGFRRIDLPAMDHGSRHIFTGIALSDVLLKAGVAMGAQLRGKNMPQYVLAKAADGYEVLFALPELDSAFQDKTIILADQMDGFALPQGKGPYRIVVPGDKKPARWIWDVRSLTVGTPAN